MRIDTQIRNMESYVQNPRGKKRKIFEIEILGSQKRRCKKIRLVDLFFEKKLTLDEVSFSFFSKN